MLLYFTYFCGVHVMRQNKKKKKGFTHVQLLSCKYFQWYTRPSQTTRDQMQYYVKKLSKSFPGAHTLNGNIIKPQEVLKNKFPKKELNNDFYSHIENILHVQVYAINALFNLSAPYVLYIGQAFNCSPENAFYIFNQQIYFFI